MNFIRFKLIYIEYVFSYVIEVWTCTEDVLGCFNTICFPVWVAVFHSDGP